MADPKKNPLIGAFRSPVPGPVPSDPAEKDPKLANQPPAADPKAVQTVGTTAPAKPGETPGKEAPKEKAAGNTPPTPTEAKKLEESPKAADPKGKTDGTAPTASTDGKKPEEPPKSADPKSKADGAAPASPTDGKKPQEPPKATDPKSKTEGTAPATPTDGKKPEEPPKATDPKGKTDGAAPAAPADGKKPEEPPKAADPKGKTDSAAPAAQQGASAPAQEEDIPPDFSLNIVPSNKLGTVTMMPLDLIDDFEGHPFEVRDDKDMEELVASIKQVGLLEPATIIPNEKKVGRFEMVAGHPAQARGETGWADPYPGHCPGYGPRRGYHLHGGLQPETGEVDAHGESPGLYHENGGPSAQDGAEIQGGDRGAGGAGQKAPDGGPGTGPRRPGRASPPSSGSKP